MSTQTLIRLGGSCTILAGGLFAATALLLAVGQRAPSFGLLAIAYVGLVFGALGLYAPQASRAGKIGLAGFGLAGIGAAGSVVPAYVVYAALSGVEGARPMIGSLMLHMTVDTVLIEVGFLLLGAATLRAGVLPRWAGWALIASTIVVIAQESLMLPILPAGTIAFAAALLGSGAAVSALAGQSAGLATRLAGPAAAPAT